MTFRTLALAAAITVAAVAPAIADETGFASMHDQRREGAKTCFTDHFHYGQSYGVASKKSAEVAAIKDWQGFTAFEYGSSWSNFQLAGSRGIKCEQGPSGWGCNVEARPCRAGGSATAAKAKKKG